MRAAAAVAALSSSLAPVASSQQPPAPQRPQGAKPPEATRRGQGKAGEPTRGLRGTAPIAAAAGNRRHRPGGPVQRLADGHPDMQGYWNAANDGGALFEVQSHPVDRPGVPAGKGAIVDPADGLLPYQPWAAAKAKDNFDSHMADEPDLHCYMSGVPKQIYAQFGFQILQPAGYVVMTWEFMHSYRIVPTDGRPHIPAGIHLYQGDPVGHWEGDTLVVDTTNLNDRTWLDSVGNFHSDGEHVVERFTPVDTNTIKYEATVDDAKVFTKPWKIAFDLYRNVDPKYEQMEFACIEGNQDLPHYTKDQGGSADVKVK